MHAATARPPVAFTLAELMVVMGIVGVLMSLILPSLISARHYHRRVQCATRLMQLSLAVASYESAHRVLPPGVVAARGPVVPDPADYQFSWLAQVLPYLGEENLQRELDFGVGVAHPANVTARSRQVGLFTCPEDTSPIAPGLGRNSYAACHDDRAVPIDADNHGVFFLNSAVRLDDITDGLAHTLFLGEKLTAADELGWASGTRATLRNTGTPIGSTAPGRPIVVDGVEHPAVGGFGSEHDLGHGANFAFGDGSVRYLTRDIDPAVYRRLAHRADGELVDPAALKE